jgi:flagellum-specific ATP synthase
MKPWGTVGQISAQSLEILGIDHLASVGDEVSISTRDRCVTGEVFEVESGLVRAFLYSDASQLRIGDKTWLSGAPSVAPGDHWLGRIVGPHGEVLDGSSAAAQAEGVRPLQASAPPAASRRDMGERLSTGLMVTDTLLPICRGQRIGLFAGSGVGKSTLLGQLAAGVDADRIVVGLIGERSREVGRFASETLPESVRDRAVIVAATASEPPGAKRRAAHIAMAAAEHFRDEGHHVLLLFDSLTRFAEAHREIALEAGEPPALNAFPPSTVRLIAQLAERAGPGTAGQGDITAVFSVLVAGSDMNEPVADMVRGILDGHVVLSREIAERGRFPAIDVLRSVSRSLPEAATEKENALISEVRKCISLHEEILPMLRASLYEFGKDAHGDRAIERFPEIDTFLGMANDNGIAEAFGVLADRISGPPPEVGN